MRALIAIINFAFFLQELLIESYIESEIFTGIGREINYCNRCAHPPQLLRSPPPPSQKPPFGNPSPLHSQVVCYTFGGVPTTPDPNTSAKVSRYKWEAYRDTNWWCIYYFLPRGRHTFGKSMAIEMGGVSRYFSKVLGSGVDSTRLNCLGKRKGTLT